MRLVDATLPFAASTTLVTTTVATMRIAIFFITLTAPLAAGDWPQILGPTRNGVAAGDERISPWSSDGPTHIWDKRVGEGLAGVAVAKGRVVLFHREGDREVIEALSASNGQRIWEADYPTDYQSGISPDSGPRCVPIIDEDAVITFGAEGILTCLDLASGKVRWTVDTHAQFQPPPSYFGAGSTPIVVGRNVIVNVGARGAGVVAFDKTDGKVMWKKSDEAASYAAPVSVSTGTDVSVLMATRLQFVGLNPKTGNERFRIPFGKRGPTVNGATPVVINGHAFLTASYGIGALLVKLNDAESTPVWSKEDLISSQYVTPVPMGSTLFGADGRDDAGRCDLVALDAISGKERWRERNFGYASVTRAGDKLLLLGTEGELVLAEADPTAYKELSRTKLFNSTTRALPALANGRLYARDTKTLRCVQVGLSQ